MNQSANRTPLEHDTSLVGEDIEDPISTFVDPRIGRLSPTMTVKDAISLLKHESEQLTTMYYGYVIDENHKLIGVVSLRQLLTAKPEQLVGEVMETDVIFAYVDEDQEVAARRLHQYDLLGLPIITRDKQLIGLLTRLTANKIMAQEQTEDFEKLMAIGGSHRAGVYLKTSVFQHFRNRIPWITGLAIIGMISGYILHAYEETLATFIILALYIPMIADTGGNTGSQSATVVIRALALGEISVRDGLKVLFKEFRVALLVALVLGVVTFLKILLLSGGQADNLTRPLTLIGIVITVALMLQVITSTVIGAVLPLVVAKFKLDPATVASPTLTTLVDISGLLIFFALASRLLGI
jgi:magnesium transporter